jgi:hypothetical protein
MPAIIPADVLVAAPPIHLPRGQHPVQRALEVVTYRGPPGLLVEARVEAGPVDPVVI